MSGKKITRKEKENFLKAIQDKETREKIVDILEDANLLPPNLDRVNKRLMQCENPEKIAKSLCIFKSDIKKA